jgi:5-methylcytosine-specific restriction enzyme A
MTSSQKRNFSVLTACGLRSLRWLFSAAPTLKKYQRSAAAKMPDMPGSVSGDPSSDELRTIREAARQAERKERATKRDKYRGSAASRGYGSRWRRLRRMILNQQPLCVRCGAPATDVDHIVPRAAGGDDSASNLQGLCKSCHSRKTATQDGGFGRG